MAENTKFPTFVIDASFLLSALLPDEHIKKVDTMFTKFALHKVVFKSSYLLPFEVINSIKIAMIRKRIGAGDAKDLVELFLGWDITYEEVNFREIFDLALEKGITVYDASYLWLAKSMKVKFLTLDENLQKLSK